jgi:hypothetical protein
VLFLGLKFCKTLGFFLIEYCKCGIRSFILVKKFGERSKEKLFDLKVIKAKSEQQLTVRNKQRNKSIESFLSTFCYLF